MKFKLRPPMELITKTDDETYIWFTRSQSDPNRIHTTIRSHWSLEGDTSFEIVQGLDFWYYTCTCIGWQTHKKCWHIEEVTGGE